MDFTKQHVLRVPFLADGPCRTGLQQQALTSSSAKAPLLLHYTNNHNAITLVCKLGRERQQRHRKQVNKKQEPKRSKISYDLQAPRKEQSVSVNIYTTACCATALLAPNQPGQLANSL